MSAAIRPMEPRRVVVREVIEVMFARGAGTAEDVVREVTQYYDFEGNLLAEQDDFAARVMR